MPRNFDLRGRLTRLPADVKWKEPRILVRLALGLLLAANLVAAIVAFNLLGASPEALEQQLSAASTRLQAEQVRLTRSHALAEKVGKGKAEADTFLASYFTNRRNTYSTIINEIYEAARNAGLKTQEGQISALDPIEGTDDLSMMTISVNFEGTFSQLVKLVNQLDRSPRFIIIESMQVAPQPKGDLINTNLKFHVFVKEDAGGAL